MAERRVSVWKDTVRVGRCRSERCGAKIWFAQTVGRGKNMPFDGDPVPLRTLTDHETGRLIWEVLYESSHFRSCPAADEFSAARRS